MKPSLLLNSLFQSDDLVELRGIYPAWYTKQQGQKYIPPILSFEKGANWQAVYDKIETYREPLDWYFGINPKLRNTDRPGLSKYLRGKGNIASVRCLWLDLDGYKNNIDLRVMPAPSAVVSTGGKGLHIYWLLREETKEFELVEKLNNVLAEELGQDHCGDITRIFRLPGTEYRKYSDFVGQSKLLHYKNLAYSLDRLESIISQFSAWGVYKTPKSNLRGLQGASGGLTLQELYKKYPMFPSDLRKILERGYPEGTNWSDVDYMIVKRLKEGHVDIKDCYAILTAEDCALDFGRKVKPHDYLLRTIGKGYADGKST